MSSPHRFRTLLITAALLCAAVLSPTPSTGAVAVADPAALEDLDFPRLPESCVGNSIGIPAEPLRCPINEYVEGRPTVVLWGDSHAWMMLPALVRAVGDRPINVVAYLMGSCPPMDPQLTELERVSSVACLRSNDLAVRDVLAMDAAGTKLRVVLGSSWHRTITAWNEGDTTSYVGRLGVFAREGTPQLFETLATHQIPVDLLGQAPTVPETLAGCERGDEPYLCSVDREDAFPVADQVSAYLESLLEPLGPRSRLITVSPSVCGPQVCRGLIDGVETWFDDLHLSATRTAKLSSYLSPLVEELAPTPRGRKNCWYGIFC